MKFYGQIIQVGQPIQDVKQTLQGYLTRQDNSPVTRVELAQTVLPVIDEVERLNKLIVGFLTTSGGGNP